MLFETVASFGGTLTIPTWNVATGNSPLQYKMIIVYFALKVKLNGISCAERQKRYHIEIVCRFAGGCSRALVDVLRTTISSSPRDARARVFRGVLGVICPLPYYLVRVCRFAGGASAPW